MTVGYTGLACGSVPFLPRAPHYPLDLVKLYVAGEAMRYASQSSEQTGQQNLHAVAD